MRKKWLDGEIGETKEYRRRDEGLILNLVEFKTCVRALIFGFCSTFSRCFLWRISDDYCSSRLVQVTAGFNLERTKSLNIVRQVSMLCLLFQNQFVQPQEIVLEGVYLYLFSGFQPQEMVLYCRFGNLRISGFFLLCMPMFIRADLNLWSSIAFPVYQRFVFPS